jgi:Glycosyltransferase family 9 (heptosyltransferase)
MSRYYSKKDYKEFVFLSAGPVGDHALVVDDANRFFESTGIPSTIIMKHPSPFLEDMAEPYRDHISYLSFKGIQEKIKVFLFALSSMWIKRCYVLVLPIPPPPYLKLFAYYIRFFTRSRFVGLTSLCAYGASDGPKRSATFLGKGNYTDAHVDTQLFYEQANALLEWLGYKKITRPPALIFHEDKNVLGKFDLEAKKYIVFHLVGSGVDKSLPPDRWQKIIEKVYKEAKGYKIVFSGGVNDWDFIQTTLGGVQENEVVNLCGKVGMSQLLTVYKHAALTVTVHTGNAILINMLHVKNIIVNMKGVYMFKYHYNKESIDFTGTDGCTCNPYERHCTMVPYKGQEYMACVFSNDDEKIKKTIVEILPSA